MAPITQGLEVEKFCVLCLNWKGRLIKRAEMSSGIANSCLFQPREVFRPAIQEGASGIICVHNHPSGVPVPSPEDVRITCTLRALALRHAANFDFRRLVSALLCRYVVVLGWAIVPSSIGFTNASCALAEREPSSVF
jgi:hypothetical protein